MPVDDPAAVAPSEPPAQLRRRVARGGTILILTRWGVQIFVWASTLMVARFLVPDDYAILALGILLVELAELFVEAGMTRALIQKRELEKRDVDEVFTLTLLIGLALYGLFFLGADAAQTFFERPEFATFLRVLSLHLVLMPFMAVPLALLDRNLELGKQSYIHVVCSIVQTGLVLSLAYLGFGYWALAVGSLTRRALEVVIYTIISGWRPRLAGLTHRAREMLGFGLHNSGATFLHYVYSHIDYALVNAFDKLMLGYYALAFQLITLPANLLSANVAKIAYPALCRLHDEPARQRDWFLRLHAILSFFSMPVMAGMALVAADAIPLVLGEKWAPAVVPFQLLCLAGLFRALASLLPVLNNARGRPDLNLKITLARFLILPPAFFLGGYYYGVIGISLVWMLVYPAVVLLMITLTRQATQVGVLDLLRTEISIITATALMALPVIGVAYWLADAGQVERLATQVIVGVLAYTAAGLVLCRTTVLRDLWKLVGELRSGR